MAKILQLDPDEVRTSWRARADLGDINGLVSSIAELGQLQPICVERVNGEYRLIAGLRRLTACQNLHQKVLAVETAPRDELAEIDMQLAENVRRKEFDLLELGEGLAQRKRVYERLHPSTKAGGVRPGAGRPPKNGKKRKPDPAEGDLGEDSSKRFTLLASQKLGLSESRVKEALQIAGLSRAEREEIAKIADPGQRNKAALRALKKMRAEKRLAKVEAAAEERKKEAESEEASGQIVLHHMDNADFFRACNEVRFDLIYTDPPYQTDRKSLISHTVRPEIDHDFGAWDQLDVGWVARAAPLLEPGGQMLIHCPLEAIGDYRTVCQAVELAWRGAIIWKRTNPGTAHRPIYLSACEAIVWATKAGSPYHFEPWENAGAEEAHNFVTGPICGGNERLSHPTQKPEWLVERFLRRHAHEFSHVLDPFAGVGTTLAICKRLGIRATGVERDDGYVSQARIRLAAIEGK